MNTTFLATFVRIAELGSFRETARVLGATQAAVSQRIAALEQELAVRLLERTARPVRLTAAGERVLQTAQQLLALEQTLALCARPDAPPQGRVRVGVIESVVHTWFSALLRRVSARAPAVELDLSVDTARKLRERFTRGHLDVIIQNDALENAPGQAAPRVMPLCRYPIAWIARPGLLPNRRLQASDLTRVPLITFSRASSPHAQLQALCDAHGLDARITNCPSVAGILRLASDGFGLAAIPPLFVRSNLQRRSLQRYAGPALPALTISLAHARTAGPAAQLLAAETQAVVSAYCSQAGARWAQLLVEPARTR